MRTCDNCRAKIPDGQGGYVDGFGFVCCVHCVFNPLGCRCEYGEYGVAETRDWTPPDLAEFEQDEE